MYKDKRCFDHTSDIFVAYFDKEISIKHTEAIIDRWEIQGSIPFSRFFGLGLAGK